MGLKPHRLHGVYNLLGLNPHQIAPPAPCLLPPAFQSVTEGIIVDGEKLSQHRLAILSPEKEIIISADTKAHCMIIGGEPVGKRYKWWNFVSSNSERIEIAKQDWQKGNFGTVPGETEFIPLPEEA